MSIILEAHRGLAVDYPENTLVALRAAKKLGYGMIEVDTKITKDGHCILMHDSKLNRTTRYADGGELPADAMVSEWNLEEIRKLDAGVWMGDQFRGEKVPLFREAVAFAKEAQIPLKLDNIMWRHTPEQRRAMYDVIEELDALEYVGFTTAKVEFIPELLERFPKAHVHYDGVPDEENFRALQRLLPREQLTVWLRQDNAGTSWCKTPAVTPELADQVRPFATIGLWLITQPEELAAAEAMKVDLAETDGTLRP